MLVYAFLKYVTSSIYFVRLVPGKTARIEDRFRERFNVRSGNPGLQPTLALLCPPTALGNLETPLPPRRFYKRLLRTKFVGTYPLNI